MKIWTDESFWNRDLPGCLFLLILPLQKLRKRLFNMANFNKTKIYISWSLYAGSHEYGSFKSSTIWARQSHWRSGACRDHRKSSSWLSQRRNEDWEKSLTIAYPSGVNIYFDNVGREISDKVHQQINRGGKDNYQWTDLSVQQHFAFCGAKNTAAFNGKKCTDTRILRKKLHKPIWYSTWKNDKLAQGGENCKQPNNY